MNYADLIKDAFWITLRNRFLWFFGFFAGSGAGGASFNLSSPPSSPGGSFEGEDVETMNNALPLVAQELRRWVFDSLALIITVGVVVFLILLILFALGVLSSGAGIVLGIAALIVLLVLPAIVLLVAGSNTGAIVASAVALPIWLILIIVALAALSTFYHSYWTLAYLRLVAGEVGPQAG